MSASPQADPAHAADAHDDDDEPINELLPDEPHTPMWLPLLGGVLTLVALVVFVAMRPPGKTAEQLSKESVAAAQANAPPPAAAPVTPVLGAAPTPAPRPGAPAPPGG